MSFGYGTEPMLYWIARGRSQARELALGEIEDHPHCIGDSPAPSLRWRNQVEA